jgi:hypothetical protein
MISLRGRADYGCTGQYVARITGRDSKFTFEREFLGKKIGKRGDVTEADVDEPGLYEECDAFWASLDGENARRVDKEMAMKIARGLGEHRAIGEMVAFVGDDDVELRTAAQAEKAKAAGSLEAAIARCQEALAALPEPMVRKALIELRKRCLPLPATKAEPPIETEPAHAGDST